LSLLKVLESSMPRSLLRLELEVTPREDVLLQPMSSKALKSATADPEGCLHPLWELYLAHREAVTFRCLVDGSGRRLYSQGGQPLVARRGERLRGAVSAVASSLSASQVAQLATCEGRVSVGPGTLEYRVASASLVRGEELSVGLGRRGGAVKVSFLTPTAIPLKVMTPPWASRLSRRIPNAYRLLPEPAYIAAYAAKLLLRLSGAAGDAPLYHYYVGRLVDMYAVEVDYDVRPTTAVIGRDYLGRLRLLRGFTGWAVYSVKEGLGSAVLDRLLAIASELGVGKLRAMGMGEVRAEVIGPREARQATG
jgi:hypothetical protein